MLAETRRGARRRRRPAVDAVGRQWPQEAARRVFGATPRACMGSLEHARAVQDRRDGDPQQPRRLDDLGVVCARV
jgi:hypothetical protein